MPVCPRVVNPQGTKKKLIEIKCASSLVARAEDLTLLHELGPCNSLADGLLIPQVSVRHEGPVQPRPDICEPALRVVLAEVEEFWVPPGLLWLLAGTSLGDRTGSGSVPGTD